MAMGGIVFSDLNQLLGFKDDKRLLSVITSWTCLTTVAHITSNEEFLKLLGFVNSLNLDLKHFTVHTPSKITSSLNQSINFNVDIHMMNREVGSQNLISLCPILGEQHAVIQEGHCPPVLQNPRGKLLQISFFGPLPYIKYHPSIGGSDFIVAKILAEKYRFRTKFHLERNAEVVDKNGTKHGMLHSVRCSSPFRRISLSTQPLSYL